MKVIEPGHIYQLQHLDGSGAGILVFANREAGTEHEGTQTQEVLRALIDRTQHCDECRRWDGNDKIIYHLRMAISLHEARALERKVEKGELKPEMVETAPDGHFKLATTYATAYAAAAALDNPKTTDYCLTCGQSPDSSIHVLGVGSHTYADPRLGPPWAPYKCNVPMCGDSGICDECRRRGAR